MGAAALPLAMIGLGMGASYMMNKQNSGMNYSGGGSIPTVAGTIPEIPKAPELPEDPTTDDKAANEAEELAKKQAALRQKESGTVHTSGLGLASSAYSKKKQLLGAG